jgi:tetratricopeptide (TPR) repeat protein
MEHLPRPSPAVRRVAGVVGLVVVIVGCGGGGPPASPGVAPSPPVGVPGSPAPSPSPSPSPSAPTAPTTATRATVDRLRAAALADPTNPDTQRDLGLALLQLIRETLDPTLYAQAESALRAADRLRPDDPGTLVGIGGLQLGRHEFAQALETGRHAVEVAPSLTAARGVVVDALVELGRYPEADAEAGRMFALGDDLGTLARVSYIRELHGDVGAALAAMTAAAAQPGLAPENQAFALSLQANLQRWTGDPAAARATWQRALGLVPDHPPSLAGLARLAVGDGRLDEAADLFGRAADVIPLPEYVIALGEIRQQQGDATAASHSFALAEAEIRLFQANGVTVDLDLALFEADHGDPSAALRLARTAFARTPTTRAADAVGWALHRLGRDADARRWSQKALRLGSRDPLLRYHAGAIEAALGTLTDARRDLGLALDTDPGFSAAGAADARRLLAALGETH